MPWVALAYEATRAIMVPGKVDWKNALSSIRT